MESTFWAQREKRGRGWKPVTGYGGYSKLSGIVIPFFNRILASLFLIIGLPVFLIIALIIKLKYGGPVFYKGIRLGMYKRPYVMYKFRTLPVGAQAILGAKEFSLKDFRLPLFSRFLRDSRLDELPQLFNILKGEMDFLGPRPLRPEIYETYCKHIPNYDVRFLVRPGLIGFSQLCTPHSAPKRIRSIIDNKAIKLKRYIFPDLIIVFVTIFIILKNTIVLLMIVLKNYVINIKILKRYHEKRKYDRVPQKKTVAEILLPSGDIVVKGIVVDLNEEYFKLKVEHDILIELEGQNLSGRLYYYKEKGSRKKKKTAWIQCRFYKKYSSVEDGNKSYYYIFHFIPKGEFYKYVIDQYFIRKSILHYMA